MIYRVVLAVVLATALVAATLGPIDDARRQRTSAMVSDQASEIERVADTLLETDDPLDGPGARRVVTLRVPTRTWTSGGVERVSLRPPTDQAPARLSWLLTDGQPRTRQLPGVPLRTPDGGPVVLRRGGRHRLVLSLDGRPGAPVLTVRRLK
ncbi:MULTISPECIES: DUF7311 family protein [Halomicrobium]|uniref:DUF7311 domain-containing protein n=2 Tax=Halomicrobium mukohataei TaxID=57705 RepID=C7P1S3_HALMD|nr:MULTISPECIES: hypothetical protein [Halomicrobium]ACV49163.1 conserved hypothetical protein [Halomicrobium mukohataei DSM 12286]QCD64571.1 ABC transporter [Halomicrobium mukohataei]QFR19378.1 ABC transporter [Halomicrobium sp. ZPS1]